MNLDQFNFIHTQLNYTVSSDTRAVMQQSH